MKYDPKHIISQRRQEYGRALFQHSQAETWIGEANSLIYDHIWISEPLKEIVEARDHVDFLQSNTAQGKVEQISPKKRSEPEHTEMDIKKPETSKKQKVAMGTEIIDIDMIKELVITPTIIQEDVSQTIVENTTVNPEESSKLSSIPVLQYKTYKYAADAKDQFKNKQNLLLLMHNAQVI